MSTEATKKIAEGLALIGAGLIALSQEMGGAVQAATPVKEEKKALPEAKKEEKKEEKKEVAKEVKKVEAVEEVKTVDLGELRDSCKKTLLALVKVDREKAVSLLADFGVKKLTEVADKDLEALAEKLLNESSN